MNMPLEGAILAGQFPILITWRGAVEESIRKWLHHTLSGLHPVSDTETKGKGSYKETMATLMCQ